MSEKNINEIRRVVKDYKILEVIGKGSQGEVFKGVHLPSSVNVAIKVYAKSNLNEN